MNTTNKEIILLVAVGMAALLMGLIIGFLIGVWSGNIGGYDDGVDAGINYSYCIVEETPLYSVVTDEVIDYCWETYVYETG